MNPDPLPRIRPATNADIEAVTALVFAILKQYGLAPDPEDTDADLKDIEASYMARGGSFDVLEDPRGAIAGCVGLVARPGGVCVLRKMYLRADLRGRGLGKALLEHALQRARELGFRRVNLETASVLQEAIGLYRAFGFRPFDDPHLPARCDQAYFLELE